MPFALGGYVRGHGRGAPGTGRLMVAAGPGFLGDGQRELEKLVGHNPNLPHKRAESKAVGEDEARLTDYLRMRRTEDGRG